MQLMVKLFRRVHGQAVLHAFFPVDAVEVVVPDAAISWNEEEAGELVREDNLDAFIVVRRVALESYVLCCFSSIPLCPVKTLRGQLVEAETAASLGEAS